MERSILDSLASVEQKLDDVHSAGEALQVLFRNLVEEHEKAEERAAQRRRYPSRRRLTYEIDPDPESIKRRILREAATLAETLDVLANALASLRENLSSQRDSARYSAVIAMLSRAIDRARLAADVGRKVQPTDKNTSFFCLISSVFQALYQAMQESWKSHARAWEMAASQTPPET